MSEPTNPGDDPTLDEARLAVETARSLRKLARRFLGLTK